MTAREVARRNYEYAHNGLNYLSCRQYRRLFSTLPISWSWEELAYMRASYKPRILQLARVAQRVPLLTSLIRTFWTRVLMFRKTLIVVEQYSSPTPLRNLLQREAPPHSVLC